MTRSKTLTQNALRLAALPLLAAPLMLAACGPSADSEPVDDAAQDVSAAPAAGSTEGAGPGTRSEDLPALIPPAPGEPGGLDDDRTPLAEPGPGNPIDPEGAEGAAQVVQRWGALLEQGHYKEARALWGDDGKASGMSAAQYRAAYDKYSEIHVLVGRPGEIEGAAGSLYVTVPVQMYGRMAESGKPFNLRGPVTLRRVNGVDGATPEQLRWHLSDSALKPMGTVREAR